MRAFRRNLEEIAVPVVAVLTAAMGLVDVLSAVTPSLTGRLRLLERFSPLYVSRGGHLASALAGFALLVLSRNLWRRKQVAWALTLGILVLSIAVHLIKGLDYEEASLAAGLSILLILLRPYFHARSDEPSLRQGLQLLAASLIFTLAYGVLGFYLLDRHYSVNFGFLAALRQTVVMFTQFYDPGLQPVTRFGRYFANSIYLVGATTFGYALLMLLRPVLARPHASAAERERASDIVCTYGRTPLARFALFEDKTFFFSPGGSLISFAVQSRVALALGDPIGPPEDLPAALRAFGALCASNDWRSAFYQVLPDSMLSYREAGYELLTLGHEAIVPLSGFSLEGSEKKNIRNAVTKMKRQGYTAGVIEPPYSSRMMRELEALSDDWLSSRGASELRFSMGWFDPAYLATCPIMLVRDREGFIEAFANIVIQTNMGEAAVDLMRYRGMAEKGIMDFLFVSLLEWGKGRGYERFDLGFSALSGIGERPDDPALERALKYAYERMDRVYNFKGLHAFKEKFHPEWSPRYLAYRGSSSLPMVLSALVRLQTGPGLLRGVLGLRPTR